MRLLCQYIALRANGEDGEGLGRFWQSRFKAVRILDEETLLACAAYVDLNPIRAALADTLEESDYTSVQRRLAALKSNGTNSEESQASDRVDRVDDFLSPISIDERKDPLGAHPSRNKKRCSDKGFLAMAEADYLEILDWLARNAVAGKRGSTPAEAPAIFERRGIDSGAWSETRTFNRGYISSYADLANLRFALGKMGRYTTLAPCFRTNEIFRDRTIAQLWLPLYNELCPFESLNSISFLRNNPIGFHHAGHQSAERLLYDELL